MTALAHFLQRLVVPTALHVADEAQQPVGRLDACRAQAPAEALLFVGVKDRWTFRGLGRRYWLAGFPASPAPRRWRCGSLRGVLFFHAQGTGVLGGGWRGCPDNDLVLLLPPTMFTLVFCLPKPVIGGLFGWGALPSLFCRLPSTPPTGRSVRPSARAGRSRRSSRCMVTSSNPQGTSSPSNCRCGRRADGPAVPRGWGCPAI